MTCFIDVKSSIPGMLDNDTIQNIIKVIEVSNSNGLDRRSISTLYCSQTTDSNNNNSLGIHVAFKGQDKVDPCS